MQHIFVYGTLLSHKILKKLTGKSFKTSVAVLPKYQLFSVKECDYPAIIQQDDSKTDGLLIENMDDSSLAIISFYEGDEYEKKKVTVHSDGKFRSVLTFVWVNGNEFLEKKDWNLNDFEESCLEHYLEMVIPETLEEFYLNR